MAEGCHERPAIRQITLMMNDTQTAVKLFFVASLGLISATIPLIARLFHSCKFQWGQKLGLNSSQTIKN